MIHDNRYLICFWTFTLHVFCTFLELVCKIFFFFQSVYLHAFCKLFFQGAIRTTVLSFNFPEFSQVLCKVKTFLQHKGFPLSFPIGQHSVYHSLRSFHFLILRKRWNLGLLHPGGLLQPLSCWLNEQFIFWLTRKRKQ